MEEAEGVSVDGVLAPLPGYSTEWSSPEFTWSSHENQPIRGHMAEARLATGIYDVSTEQETKQQGG